MCTSCGVSCTWLCVATPSAAKAPSRVLPSHSESTGVRLQASLKHKLHDAEARAMQSDPLLLRVQERESASTPRQCVE